MLQDGDHAYVIFLYIHTYIHTYIHIQDLQNVRCKMEIMRMLNLHKAKLMEALEEMLIRSTDNIIEAVEVRIFHACMCVYIYM